MASVFRAWDEAGIEFLILRNYENLPETTTNDIDVLVSTKDLEDAERVLLGAARLSGFRLHNRAEFATLALYFSSEESTAQAHFDLFTTLKWRSFDFLDCADFLRNRVARGIFWVPRPAHEAATNLLANLIYKGRVKEKYKPLISAGFAAEPDAAEELISKTYGRIRAQNIVAAGRRQDWNFLESAGPALRRALVWRQLQNPIRTIGSLLADTRRLLHRFLHPPGLTVVFCGPDGSGKSTVSKSVIAGMAQTFSPLKGRQFHWKIPVFSGRRIANRAPTSDPHGKPARGKFLSALYFLFHWTEFVLGSHGRLRPITFRGGLVLIDRYYYDFFVDARRYRLRIPSGWARLGYAFVKKPDLVILLDAPAEVLKQRKDEIPLPEIERQRAAFRELVQSLPQGRIVDANQAPDQVSVEVQKLILATLAQRSSRPGGSRAEGNSKSTPG